MYRSIDPGLIVEYFPRVFPGIYNTLIIVISAVVIGLLLGTMIALVRINRIPVLSSLMAVFISFVRGTPVIIQLFVVYYGLPMLLRPLGVDISQMAAIYFVILAYGVSSSATLAEIIRAAVLGVPPGQSEAACSVGLTRLQAFRHIIGPQAALTALPGFGSSVIGLLENTSLAFTLGVIDMIGKVKSIGAVTYHTMEGYICASIVFVVLSLMLRVLFHMMEYRLKSKLIPGGLV